MMRAYTRALSFVLKPILDDPKIDLKVSRGRTFFSFIMLLRLVQLLFIVVVVTPQFW
jgi:hypothetical protein